MKNHIIPSKQNPADWEPFLENWRLPTWQWAIPFELENKKFGYGIPEIFEPQILAGAKNPLYEFQNPVRDSNNLPLPMDDPKMGRYALPTLHKVNVSCQNCLIDEILSHKPNSGALARPRVDIPSR
jgi:hypothetical protein